MGEVKVNVKLTNAMDQAMFRRDLIPREQIRSVSVEAVVDTGAVRSCIPVDLMQEMGLQVVRHINAQMANGLTESVAMTEGVDMEIMGRLVTEAFLVLGSEVLIGQTALEATDLLVDCNRQKVITNPDHPNSAVILTRTERLALRGRGVGGETLAAACHSFARQTSSTSSRKSASALVKHIGGLMRRTLP